MHHPSSQTRPLYRLPEPATAGFVSNSVLVLLAFASMFFSRCLNYAGAPAPINFVHFATIPAVSGFVLFSTPSLGRDQYALAKRMLIGIFVLLGVNLASALLNQAGAINALLNFILWSEAFIFLLALSCLRLSVKSFHRLKIWTIGMASVNLLLAFVQRYVMNLHLLANGPDNIKGAFWGQGGGHVVGASVAITFALYFLVASQRAWWMRAAVMLLAFWHIMLADAKQVLVTLLVAFVILILNKSRRPARVFMYAAILAIFVALGLWAADTVFPALKTWARPEIYAWDGEATRLKLATFRIVPSHFDSPLNWLLGLGPGHTVGRLGGWMLQTYRGLLSPFGSTIHPASSQVWQAVSRSWLGDQSSLFSPLFGWAGLWGDLGFAGLLTYLYLGSLVWKYFCKDDMSKFLLLTFVTHGFIFSQMEEPGYALSIALVIGLRLQEWRLSARQRDGLVEVG